MERMFNLLDADHGVVRARSREDAPKEECPMLFQVTHVHTSDQCPGTDDELGASMGQWWAGLKATAGVTVLSGYVSPMDHTLYITVEADEIGPLLRGLGPLNAIGSGYTTPIISLDQAMPLVDEGVFQLPEE
ncbi:MAG: hypothetical protein AB7L91_15770 [Dehalococcoidia bacterium]